MAGGDTYTTVLTDSLDIVLASARKVREQQGVMTQLVDKVTLGEGTGLSWREVSMEKLTAQAISETTDLDNPQKLEDTLTTITPSVVGIHTFISNRVAARISKKAFAQTGGLAQTGVQRKKDEDGLTALDGATTQLGTTNTALAIGEIEAASYRVTSNTTEPGPDPVYAVFHGFQIKDIADELTAAVGSLLIAPGITTDVFQNKFQGKVANAMVFEDGNLSIDALDDAKGGVFSKMALILVQGRAPTIFTRFEPQKGGGGTSLFHYDEYAYGERSPGNWLYEVVSDATAPTS